MKEFIGENIRLYRTQKGQTLRSLSNQIGISYQQLSRIERGGGTSSTTLERIANVLGISVKKLLQEPEKTRQSFFGKTKCFVPELVQTTINQKLYTEIIKPINDSILSAYWEQIHTILTDPTLLQRYLSSIIGSQQETITFSKQELVQFSKHLLEHFTSILSELSKIYPEEENSI